MRTDGWKHFLSRGQVEISGYYKTRRNVVALRPEAFIEDDQWSNYIMEGDGDSYGIKGYFFQYLEAMDSPAFLCLYPKQGMVRRPERTGQASFPL